MTLLRPAAGVTITIYPGDVQGTIAGDVSQLGALPGMVLIPGRRSGIKAGSPAETIAEWTPTGTTGGTFRLLAPFAASGGAGIGFLNEPFVVDNGGGGASLALTNIANQQRKALGLQTNLDAPSKVVNLDAAAGVANTAQLLLSRDGRLWGDRILRNVGGVERIEDRVYPDGATAVTALRFDPATGGVVHKVSQATVAVAATTPIFGAGAGRILLSGSGTITAFDVGPNEERHCVADAGATITLTHSAVIQVQGNANVVIGPGDSFRAYSNGAGTVVQVDNIQRAARGPDAALTSDAVTRPTDYTMDDAGVVYLSNRGVTNTGTLPKGSDAIRGRPFFTQNIGTGRLDVFRDPPDTIDGGVGGGISYPLQPGERGEFRWDGGTWRVVVTRPRSMTALPDATGPSLVGATAAGAFVAQSPAVVREMLDVSRSRLLSAVKTNTFTTTAGTPQIVPGLSVSITPRGVGSRIRVGGHILLGADFWFTAPKLRLYRNGEAIWPPFDLQVFQLAGTADNSRYVNSVVPIDYIMTTTSLSTLVFDVYVSSRLAGYNVHVNRRDLNADPLGDSILIVEETTP